MLIGYRGAAKLKTKKIIYERVYKALDGDTLSQLRELSDKRRVIEEFLYQKSNITVAIARDTSDGITSQSQQFIQKLEQYLPLLANLVVHSHGIFCGCPVIQNWVSDLKIQWSSALGASSSILGGTKFFRIDSLMFELGMSFSLYGAFLRERAFEVLASDPVQSATLFRKAAGVYNHLTDEVLPLLQSSLPKERPAEATSYFSSVMSLVCLADAQAVTAKKAEENSNSLTLLSKLHYGVTMILEEATSVMNSKSGEWKDISSNLKEILSTCKVVHELRSQRYLAEDFLGKEQIGTAVGVLRRAVDKAKNVKGPKSETSSSTLGNEFNNLNQMLRKLEIENETVVSEDAQSRYVASSRGTEHSESYSLRTTEIHEEAILDQECQGCRKVSSYIILFFNP